VNSALAGAVAVAVAVAAGATWHVVALLAIDLVELIFVAQVWLKLAHTDAEATGRIAGSEDDSPITAEIILIIAGLSSLIAVVFTLAQAGNAGAPERGLLTVLAVGSVVLAWLVVHTVFMLRYARIYYGDPPGGIGFGQAPPAYRDFAYFAFTIGMTYQVSDTNIEASRIRPIVLRHALLSYVYSAFIVATTVSSVASLLA
jgi:uncharacterized membrane protein